MSQTAQLRSLLKQSGWLKKQVASEWQQDIPNEDLTGLLIPKENKSKAVITTRIPCVLCGVLWVEEINTQLSEHLQCRSAHIQWHYQEGEQVTANQPLVSFTGASRLLLACERSILNFLQTLCATATVSREVANWDCGDCVILDTRKTLPGLRLAQKYAVCVGGCQAHRLGLSDAFLIKENHIQAAGGIQQAVLQAQQLQQDALLEVEVETIAELVEVLTLSIDRVLLDDFSMKEIEQAVALRNGQPNRIALEVSGVPLAQKTVEAIAALGVDYISLGSLTKHCHAVDLSMRFV